MLTRRLRVILLEVFKSINMLNSDCLNDMFKIKDGNYSFRNTRKLLQPKKKITTFGLRSIAYLGAIMEWQCVWFQWCPGNWFFDPKDKYWWPLCVAGRWQWFSVSLILSSTISCQICFVNAFCCDAVSEYIIPLLVSWLASFKFPITKLGFPFYVNLCTYFALYILHCGRILALG